MSDATHTADTVVAITEYGTAHMTVVERSAANASSGPDTSTAFTPSKRITATVRTFFME